MAESPVPPDRIPALDGIRGFAALLVLFWHFVPSSTRADPGTPLAYLAKAGGLGWSGVDLFFVLSGFLIGRILLRERGSPQLLRTFYFRRACRILPLLFFFVGAYALARVVVPPGDAWNRLLATPFPIWGYAAFLQNFFMTAANHFGTDMLSATWSLAVEEQFYLLAPLLIVSVPPRRLPWVFLALFGGAALVRLGLSPMGGYTLLWARADCLAAGCLLAWLVESGHLAVLARHPRRAAVIGTAFLVAAALYIQFAQGLLTAMHGAGRFHLTWIAAGYAFLIATVLAWPAGPLARLFDNRLLRRAGVLSYAIYLIHQPVLHVAFEVLRAESPTLRVTRDLWLLVPLLALVWLGAELVHRWIERPFLRLGHRLNYRPSVTSPLAA